MNSQTESIPHNNQFGSIEYHLPGILYSRCNSDHSTEFGHAGRDSLLFRCSGESLDSDVYREHGIHGILLGDTHYWHRRAHAPVYYYIYWWKIYPDCLTLLTQSSRILKSTYVLRSYPATTVPIVALRLSLLKMIMIVIYGLEPIGRQLGSAPLFQFLPTTPQTAARKFGHTDSSLSLIPSPSQHRGYGGRDSFLNMTECCILSRYISSHGPSLLPSQQPRSC